MYLPNVARQAVSLLALFSPWDKSQWLASDDVVRGGISHSSLDIIQLRTSDNPFSYSIAKFHGTLDYDTLEGSGFASQRTIDDWLGLDLSGYDRLLLEIPYTDGKKYTINLKDTVLPLSGHGVGQPTTSWAYDFQIPATNGEISISQVIINLKDLIPTIRGTVQTDTEPLDLANIIRATSKLSKRGTLSLESSQSRHYAKIVSFQRGMIRVRAYAHSIESSILRGGWVEAVEQLGGCMKIPELHVFEFGMTTAVLLSEKMGVGAKAGSDELMRRFSNVLENLHWLPFDRPQKHTLPKIEYRSRGIHPQALAR